MLRRKSLSYFVSKLSVRRLHARNLAHLTKDSPLDGVLSANGLRTAWFDRADDYMSRLNQLTRNNAELQEMTPEQ